MCVLEGCRLQSAVQAHGGNPVVGGCLMSSQGPCGGAGRVARGGVQEQGWGSAGRRLVAAPRGGGALHLQLGLLQGSTAVDEAGPGVCMCVYRVRVGCWQCSV
jgi:hypothetical protein